MTSGPYTVLPFRFARFDNEVLLVNEAGEYIFIPRKIFDKLLKYQLTETNDEYLDLKSKHFVAGEELALSIYLLATKYRTKKDFLNDYTSLHIFIVTLRCNQKCKYCQASSEDEDRIELDMDRDTAKKCVDMVFRSPSPLIKIEFQGGEPLLNFEIIKYVVQYAVRLNGVYRKKLEFVVCTNLLDVDDEKLKFLSDNNVWISTSLDGPKDIHNANRITKNGAGTHDDIARNIRLAKEVLGNNQVDALMVTTKENINRLKEVVDEYIRLGFSSIFIRTIHPYGRATNEEMGYEISSFLPNYQKALDYIIELNLKGVRLVEQYATIILSKILTPFSGGFVDLQSPAGAGISCAVYGCNGDVFVSDEGRMLSKMGDNRFKMGNVNRDSYKSIFKGKIVTEIANHSCVESMPQCSECVFQLYCGADPVRNHYSKKDLLGHTPTSDFHLMNYQIIKYLMRLIKENDRDVMNVIWSWITNRPLEEIALSNRNT